MKLLYKNCAVLSVLALSAVIMLSACDGTAVGSTTQPEDSSAAVSDSKEESGKAEESSIVEESTSGAQSEDSDSSLTEEVSSEQPQSSDSGEGESPDGIFTLADNSLSFELPEGWTLSDSSIAYQFSNGDTSNTFNLVVGTASQDVSKLTSDEMTKMYTTNMENFRLLEFNQLTIDEKPAAYVQFAGKLSQVNRESTITLCRIQSGDTEYQFSFTQSETDDTFQTVIDTVIKTLKIA